MSAMPVPEDEPIRTRLISVPMPREEGFTAADLPRLVEVIDGNFEILDGEVVMMALATHWHDNAEVLLLMALKQVAPPEFVIAREKGVNLGPSVPEPDLLVVSRSVVRAESLTFAPADVHLAVEITSPGTKTKDRVLRPRQYSDAGIRCFWRVENEDGAMIVYTFELLPEGGYAPTGVFRNRLKVDRPFPIDIELPEVTW